MSKALRAHTPEVLPAEPAAVATRGAGGLTPAARAERVLQLNAQIAESLRTFAVSVVLCGLELKALKSDVGHGKWQEFFGEHLAAKGLTLRHAQRYMEIADAFKRKNDKHVVFEVSGDLPAPSEMQPEQIQAIRDVLADMTSAETWHQLWLDFGLMRNPKPLGGKHDSRRLTEAERAEAEAATAAQAWSHMINTLYVHAVKNKTHAPLKRIQLKEIHGLLLEIAAAVKEMIP